MLGCFSLALGSGMKFIPTDSGSKSSLCFFPWLWAHTRVLRDCARARVHRSAEAWVSQQEFYISDDFYCLLLLKLFCLRNILEKIYVYTSKTEVFSNAFKDTVELILPFIISFGTSSLQLLVISLKIKYHYPYHGCFEDFYFTTFIDLHSWYLTILLW